MNCQHKEVIVFTTTPKNDARILATDSFPPMATTLPTQVQSLSLGPIEGFICLIQEPNTRDYLTGITCGGRLVRVYEF